MYDRNIGCSLSCNFFYYIVIFVRFVADVELLILCNVHCFYLFRKADVMNVLESAGFSRSNPYYIVKQGKVREYLIITTSK